MMDPGPLRKLVHALEGNDDQARQEAIRSLKAHEEHDWADTSDEAAAPLVNMLTQLLSGPKEATGIKLPPILRQAVITILGNLGPHAAEAVPQLTLLLEEGVAGNLREAAVVALGKIGKAAKTAVPKLVAILGPECRVLLAGRVARSLGDIGFVDQKVRQALSNLWTLAIPDPHSRAQVAIALCKLKIDARGLLPALTETLVSSGNANLRRAAVEALCWCRKTDTDVVPALTAALNDTEEDIQKQAEVGLSRMKVTKDKALQICGKQLAHSAHAEAALASSGAPAVPSLIAALEDEEALGREKAARALGSIGEPAIEAVPALIKTTEDKHKEVRLAAAKALWLISKQPNPSVKVLAKLLAHPWPKTESSETRRRFLQTVIEALGRIGPPAQAALPALNQVAKDDNRLIHESAIRAVRAIETAGDPVPAGTR